MSFEESSIVTLSTVDKAFGPTADLYIEVLGVKPNASSDQIQRAYFDRRNELFQLLSDLDGEEQDSVTASHRFHIERKMDAVVMAMRILGDPELRLQYDDLRHERLQGRVSPHRAPSLDEAEIPVMSHSPKSKASVSSADSYNEPKHMPSRSSKKNRHSSRNRRDDTKGHKKKRVVTPTGRRSPHKTDYRDERIPDSSHLDTSVDMNTTVEHQEDQTLVSETSTVSEGTLITTKKGFVQRVRDEVVGAIDDTATSFHQVFNAFTLSDEDISAVRNRIDKAKRQIRRSL